MNIPISKQVHLDTQSDWHSLINKLIISCVKGHEIGVVDCCVPVAHQELVNEVEFHFFSVHVHHSDLGKTDARKKYTQNKNYGMNCKEPHVFKMSWICWLAYSNYPISTALIVDPMYM